MYTNPPPASPSPPPRAPFHVPPIARLLTAFALGMLCGIYAPRVGILVMIMGLSVLAWGLGREWMETRTGERTGGEADGEGDPRS